MTATTTNADPPVRYAVANCDETVECDTLEEACRVAEEWYSFNWSVRLDPTSFGIDRLNEQLRAAYGQGEHPDAACPEIKTVEE